MIQKFVIIATQLCILHYFTGYSGGFLVTMAAA